jgi:hypothetical protein
MSHTVYAVFDNERQAERALEKCDSEEPAGAIFHEGHLREEDVQLGATQAFMGAVAGGTVVGLIGALIAWLVVWPAAGYLFTPWVVPLMALAGSLFGVVAGAVAGASECKENVRALTPEVERGRVVVTCEVEAERDADRILEACTRGGSTVAVAA